MYPKQTYGFASPAGLWKVVTKVTVWCSDFFDSIDFFYWSKNILEVIHTSLLFLLLTCVYHIYWISVHLSWKLFLGVLENCQWTVSKLDIKFCFPRRFVESRDEGDSFMISSFVTNTLILLKAVPKGFQFFSCGHKVPLG